MIAVIASVIQNAFQTPTAPKNLLSKNAAGMMTTTYPVSYTHLDVYKRQAFHNPDPSFHYQFPDRSF